MESRDNSKYDELLMGILYEEKSIPDFLNVVFGFLYRRTDLFVEQTAVGQEFGYPTGQCERLIYDCMNYFQTKAKQRNQLGEDMQIFDQVVENEEVVLDTDEEPSSVERPDRYINTEISSKIDTPPVCAETSKLNVQSTTFNVETTKSNVETSLHSVQSSTHNVETSLHTVQSSTHNVETSKSNIETSFHTVQSSTHNVETSVETPFKEQLTIHDKGVTSGNKAGQTLETQAPVINRRENTISSNCYNGTDRGSYAWAQTITDLEVEVPVNASVVKSRQVSVTVTATNIHVTADGHEAVSGTFPRPVKLDETVWTLSPGKCIQIHLEKAKDCWWDQLIQSEPKISLQHIDATRLFSELSQQEQMKVNELIWNDYQKSQGLPTSQQIKSANILKKAWDAEGSPFKGRPFDPSIINDQ